MDGNDRRSELSHAAQIVFEGARDGHLDPARLPIDLTRDEGQALQLDVLELWRNSGHPPGGWKVGLTSGQARDRMGLGFRPFGYILADRITRSGGRLSIADVPNALVEPELAVLIEHPMHGELDPEAVRERVAGVAPAFEIQQVRMAGSVSDAVQLADDLWQWGIVLGERADWVPLSDLVVTLSRDDHVLQEIGPGYAIDDALVSIAAVCRELARFGRGLAPGDVVITGAFCRLPVVTGRWSANFSGVGSVEIDFE
jgi:2-keto-4-pentenoate hydratase